MPIVRIRGQEIYCEPRAVLRDVLIRAKQSPHNGLARVANCRGHGSCGTCAVHVDGAASAPSLLERIRLALPPFLRRRDVRLACKVRVEGDLAVSKGKGFWGQRER